MLFYNLSKTVLVLTTVVSVIESLKERVYCGDDDDDGEIDEAGLQGIRTCEEFAEVGQWSDCQNFDDAAACTCSCDALADNKQPTHDEKYRNGNDKKDDKKTKDKKDKDDCFHGDGTLMLVSGKTVAIKDVASQNRGEPIYVMVSDPFTGKVSASPILYWAHADPEQLSDYQEIIFQQGDSSGNQSGHIIMTPHHLIYRVLNPVDAEKVGDINRFPKATAVFAHRIRPGDEILVNAGNSSMVQPAKVTAVRNLMAKGVYLLVTENGHVLVDGVLASCYSGVEDQRMAHWAFKIFEFIRKFWFGAALVDAYQEEGILKLPTFFGAARSFGITLGQ